MRGRRWKRQEDQIDIRLPKRMSRRNSLLGRIDESKVHNLYLRTAELAGYLRDISHQAILESLELRPIRVKADAEKSDLQGLDMT